MLYIIQRQGVRDLQGLINVKGGGPETRHKAWKGRGRGRGYLD